MGVESLRGGVALALRRNGTGRDLSRKTIRLCFPFGQPNLLVFPGVLDLFPMKTNLEPSLQTIYIYV